MNIEQLTEIAWAIVDEIEPQYSFDVFDVTDSQIIFHGDNGLRKVCLDCLDNSRSLKEQIKVSLCR